MLAIVYGSVIGLVRKVKIEVHVAYIIFLVSFQVLLAAMPCFVQLEEMGNSPCVMNYT